MSYQNATVVVPAGAVKVCATFESPLVGFVLPSIAA